MQASPNVGKYNYIMVAEHNSKIQDYLVNHRAEQFSFLSELVQFPTDHPGRDFAGLAAQLEGRLRAFGYEVSNYAVEEDLCLEKGYTPITNIVARRQFGLGPVVALAVNVDTAFAGDGWRYDPFAATIENGRMFGRGAVSAKGALAAYLFAAEALSQSDSELCGAVELHITFDGENDGDLGAGWLLAEDHVKPDLVICPGNTHSLITSANGMLQMAAEIRGRSAPGSRPADGRDAIEAATRVMAAIYRLRESYAKTISKTAGLQPPSILVSEVHGGENGHSVAGYAKLTVTRSLLPEEDISKVENEITNLIGMEVTQIPGVLCKVRRKMLTRPLIQDDKVVSLIAPFQTQANILMGNALPELGTPNGTMACHYAAAGVPTVLYGVGPVNPADAQVGATDEVLVLDDLRQSTLLLSSVLAEILKQKS